MFPLFGTVGHRSQGGNDMTKTVYYTLCVWQKADEEDGVEGWWCDEFGSFSKSECKAIARDDYAHHNTAIIASDGTTKGMIAARNALKAPLRPR
jgi:hypothetical protein